MLLPVFFLFFSQILSYFQALVTGELKNKHGIQFRDETELNQATKFHHENRLLLHYEDATLRDLYFLDPQVCILNRLLQLRNLLTIPDVFQWLCDVLSHVVTIREINPFAKNGIMRLEDLRHVFKSSQAISLTAKSYIVNLLNKFEVRSATFTLAHLEQRQNSMTL